MFKMFKHVHCAARVRHHRTESNRRAAATTAVASSRSQVRHRSEGVCKGVREGVRKGVRKGDRRVCRECKVR